MEIKYLTKKQLEKLYPLKKEEETMLDLFKEFKDWLSYNYPGTKLEPLQEDLMKIALRNLSTKVPKAASKAILR